MQRSPPNPRMEIPISMEIYHQLFSASSNTGYQKEHWEIAAEAIHEWVRRHEPDALSMPAAMGYQWKRLFLPNGTLLRTVFGGKNYHCLIEGDQIIYDGKAVSPSGFVNAVGGIRRNAWLATWVLFPDTKEWTLADALRTRERPRRARKQAHACEPAPVQHEPTAASNIESTGLQHDANDGLQGHHSRSAVRDAQQRAGIPLSPPHLVNGTERRKSANERMAALLQQELLPILLRLCSFEEIPFPMRSAEPRREKDFR